MRARRPSTARTLTRKVWIVLFHSLVVSVVLVASLISLQAPNSLAAMSGEGEARPPLVSAKPIQEQGMITPGRNEEESGQRAEGLDPLLWKDRNAALAMQRASWEQGVLAAALLEEGDDDNIVATSPYTTRATNARTFFQVQAP
jgi:hypothetical protein